MVVEGQGVFRPMPITMGLTICVVNDIPNFRGYVASLEAVLQPNKTSVGHTTCRLNRA